MVVRGGNVVAAISLDVVTWPRGKGFAIMVVDIGFSSGSDCGINGFIPENVAQTKGQIKDVPSQIGIRS